MTLAEFELMVQRSRLKPLGKGNLKDHEIYYAEAFRDPDENMAEPHWETMWAIGSGEKLDVAQKIFIPVGVEENRRIRMATDAAREFVRNCKTVNRYQ